MNNFDQSQYNHEAELKARIQATLAHASACSKACEGMADPVAEVGRLKALAGLVDDLEASLKAALFLLHADKSKPDKVERLLARVRAVKGNKP